MSRALSPHCLFLFLSVTSAALCQQRVQFEGHEYMLVEQRMTWHNAKAYAESLGGYLACVSSEEENSFLFSTAPSHCWIGATDEVVEGDWHWIDGSPWSYTNWGVGEPNNSGNEDYAAITYSCGGCWNDAPSTSIAYSIIEWDGGLSGEVVLTDVGTQLGTLDIDNALDIIPLDWNDDGWIDFLTENEAFATMKLYLNNAGTSFTDASSMVSALPDFYREISIGDINNDGQLEIVGTDGWPGALRIFTILNGAAVEVFSDASRDYYYTVLADFDNDGDLELVTRDSYYPCTMYVEDFSADLSTRTVLHIQAGAGYAAVSDFNLDGFADILFTDFNGSGYQLNPTHMMLNDAGQGFYQATTTPPNLPCSESAVFDFDNDGDFDFWCGTSDMISNGPEKVWLLEHNGTLGFTDVSQSSMLYGSHYYGQAALVDIDNNGWLDYFQEIGAWTGNHLMMNTNGTFAADPNFYFSGGNTCGHCGLFDYDLDGDMDALFTEYYWNSPLSHHTFYRNDTQGGKYLTVIPTSSLAELNTHGIRIECWTQGRVNLHPLRESMRWDATRHFHFGLGTATQADSLILHWPTGNVTRLYDVPANQFLEVYESDTQQDDCLASESFDHPGSLPTAWTVESRGGSRTSAWLPVQQNNDDWAIESHQDEYSAPFDEWLISPVIDLGWYEATTLGIWQDYQHAASSATIKLSTNAGFSWQTLLEQTASANGLLELDISSYADGEDQCRIAFVFTGEFATGGASWMIDELCLGGLPVPPMITNPIPAQSPPTVCTTLDPVIGCTIYHVVNIDGSSIEYRFDENGDGQYEAEGPEAWQSMPTVADNDTITVNQTVGVVANGVYRFEFRARAAESDYAYSGTSHQEGIADDWLVIVNADEDGPNYSQPLPSNQPDPEWTPSLTAQVGVTIGDTNSGVDASSLAYRIRTLSKQAGSRDDWQALTGYTSGADIVVLENISFPADGEYFVEFTATDLASNQSFSMNGSGDDGIEDDIVVRVDVTPPPTTVIHASGAGSNFAIVQFQPVADVSFDQMHIYYSTDQTVDESDPVWNATCDPALTDPATSQTTITGLSAGLQYWFAARATDLAGHAAEWSNVVTRATEGTQLAPVMDLTAAVNEEGVLLDWTPPSVDIYGVGPVAIQGYEVHSSGHPLFVPSESTRLETVSAPPYQIALPVGIEVAAFYRVVALGSGLTQPPAGMVFIPAGSFQMGPDPFGNGSEHTVTLTHNYWLDKTEVTNAAFLSALQWAYDEGLVSADSSTVQAYGVELVDLDDEDCELIFANGVFAIAELSHITSYGWGPGQAYPEGYDVAQHPVKEVSWFGACCYCDWRSQFEGFTPFYQGNWEVDVTHDPYSAEGYRLPMEAEWEYAARYSDGRVFPWGNNYPIGCGPLVNHTLCVGWTAAVGSYPSGASALGLLDMAGNVVEFVQDWYAGEYEAETFNPIGPSSGTLKVCRGADFGDDSSDDSKCTARQDYFRTNSYPWLGFRVMRIVQ